MIYDKLINHVDLIRCPLYHPVFPPSWPWPFKLVRFQKTKQKLERINENYGYFLFLCLLG